jgi:aldehyde:ferredoxin oxidoreductase
MINAQYGTNLTTDDVTALGMKVLTVEQEFNRKAGFSSAHDRLPEFFRKNQLAPHNEVFDLGDEALDQVLSFAISSDTAR